MSAGKNVKIFGHRVEVLFGIAAEENVAVFETDSLRDGARVAYDLLNCFKRLCGLDRL